jgi:hypothetical protein
MKNRDTARQLARANAPPCPECGQKGPHWIGVPMTLGDLLSGTEPEGFWLCDKFYGPDGKRLPANALGDRRCAASSRSVQRPKGARSTDGLGP